MNKHGFLAATLSAAVLSVSSFATPAQAIDRDFAVHNNIDETITQLFVSPTSQTTWGPDILGVDVLEDGQTANIHFTPSNYRGQCQFDIKIVAANGHQYTVSGLNLCTITGVTFNRAGSNVTFTLD